MAACLFRMKIMLLSMSGKSELYINQRESEQDVYVALQKDTIDRLQRLSGKVWTDFNAHDPGITILDVLNYALTELDYKLKFPLVDYLTEKGGVFRPEELGLFLPVSVFPINPVTVEDYRKLFLMEIPELENVWIDFDSAKGSYSVHLTLFDFMEGVIPEDVRRRVEKCFMAHRNLCETLEKVDFFKLKNVFLEGEIDMWPGTDVTAVLVKIYHQAYAYLARHVNYEGIDVMECQGVTPDEWLDGPNDRNIRITTPEKDEVRTETELYKQLCRVEGVKSIHSFFIREEKGRLVNRFEEPYSLVIPRNLRELEERLIVNVDGIPASVRFEHFASEFDVNNMISGNYLKVRPAVPFRMDHPSGNWHGIYSHDSVLDDFPDSYGINPSGLSGFADKERRAKGSQLKAYLSLFDFMFARGLKELNELKHVMKPDDRLNYPVFIPEDFKVLTDDGLLQEAVTDNDSFSRDVLKLKNRYLDMLDGVYGEDSDSAWLNEYNYYDDTEAIRLAQRVRFLKRVPEWGRNRFRACDWTAGQDGVNVPGIKAYVSVLLDWQYDEGRAVGNIFPAYNLNYLHQNEYEHQLSRMLNADLIPEQMLSQYNVDPVPLLAGPFTARDYRRMRMTLPYFYNNLLNDDLFRGGIYLENYKIVRVSGQESLLVFRNQERNVWMTLGRSSNREELVEMANILRDFLLKLNRESEAMYVVEHQYFNEPEYFVLTVVLAGWSARMVNPRFREICRRLILSRLPAHIRADFCWLDIDDMQKFEMAWRQWRKCMQQNNEVEARVAMREVERVIDDKIRV